MTRPHGNAPHGAQTPRPKPRLSTLDHVLLRTGGAVLLIQLVLDAPALAGNIGGWALLAPFLHWQGTLLVRSTLLAPARGVDAVATPGWLWLGGWPQVIDTVQFSSILRPLPFEVAVVVVPLALLGWCVVRGDLPRHVLAISVVYMTVFMVAGRPDTAYWGRLYAALLLPGLAFAPRAIALLIRGAERHCPVDESS